MGSFWGGTWGELGWDIGGTLVGHSGFWACLGQKMIGKGGLGGDRFSGQLLGQSWGWLEGKSIAFVREGVQKTQFTLNLFYVPPAPVLTPKIDVFG